jgi:hypothetical protein
MVMDADTVNIALVQGTKDLKWYVRVLFPYASAPDYIGPFDTEGEASVAYDNSSILIKKLMEEKFAEQASITKTYVQ